MELGVRDGVVALLFELDNGISLIVTMEACGGNTMMTVPTGLTATQVLTEELHTHNDSEIIRKLAEITSRPPPILHG